MEDLESLFFTNPATGEDEATARKNLLATIPNNKYIQFKTHLKKTGDMDSFAGGYTSEDYFDLIESANQVIRALSGDKYRQVTALNNKMKSDKDPQEALQFYREKSTVYDSVLRSIADQIQSDIIAVNKFISRRLY